MGLKGVGKEEPVSSLAVTTQFCLSSGNEAQWPNG